MTTTVSRDIADRFITLTNRIQGGIPTTLEDAQERIKQDAEDLRDLLAVGAAAIRSRQLMHLFADVAKGASTPEDRNKLNERMFEAEAEIDKAVDRFRERSGEWGEVIEQLKALGEI